MTATCFVDVFRHFKKDGDFFCYQGESNKSVTSMFSLYRASQVAFPAEDELQQAEIYCREFLHNRRASNTLTDKWVIPKDLPGEVPRIHCIWLAKNIKFTTRICSQFKLIQYYDICSKVVILFCNETNRSGMHWIFRGKQVCHVLKQGCIWNNMAAVGMCGLGRSSTG